MTVATVNVHKFVPGKGVKRTNGRESTAALRDVASWIRTSNADIVAVQEIENDPKGAVDAGLTNELNRLKRKSASDDGVMAGASLTAFGKKPAGTEPFASASRFGDPDGKRNGTPPAGTYDNALLVRNGYKVVESHDVDLPNGIKGGKRNRSLGVALVESPDGVRTTVAFTHTSTAKNAPRDILRQHEMIGDVLRDIRDDGSFTYRDALSGQKLTATGFERRNLLLLGDLNAGADIIRKRMGKGTGVKDVAATNGIQVGNTSPGGDSRIDHSFGSRSLIPVDARASTIENDRVPAARGDVTDHKGVIATYRNDSSASVTEPAP